MMSFKSWMDKQTVVHPDNGILFINKKKRATKSWKDMEEPKIHMAKWKKSVWKCDILFWWYFISLKIVQLYCELQY